MTNDAWLVERAREGDKEAFGELLQRHLRTVEIVAGRLIHNSEIRKELLQEAYLSLDDLTGGTWYPGVTLDDLAPDPALIAEERELQRQITAAIATLSPRNRATTLLFYFEGLSVPEIAERLAVTPTVVKGRLHKSRQQLRVQLAAEFDRNFSRRKDSPKMVEVTVSDVIQKNLDAVPTHPHRAVLLSDSAGQRVLPIWVGQFEGDAIAVALRNVSFGRPLTYNFMANIIKELGAKLREVQVSALRDETFFATVKIEVNGKIQETDARPSDAIALALTMGSPLYVTEEVMATGLPVDNEKLAELKNGFGVDAIVEKIEAERAAIFSKRDELHAALPQVGSQIADSNL